MYDKVAYVVAQRLVDPVTWEQVVALGRIELTAS
jgi:hypothetical protein